MELNLHSEHRLRSENLSFDIDVWNQILEKYTFETKCLPILDKERNAIISFNKSLGKIKDLFKNRNYSKKFGK